MEGAGEDSKEMMKHLETSKDSERLVHESPQIVMAEPSPRTSLFLHILLDSLSLSS